MTLNITYRPFVYYRCNVSFGDMLHSTHGIDHYPCSRTNRMVCENGGIIQMQAATMVIFINFRQVHASRRWYEGEWSFSMLKVNPGP